MVSFRMSEHKGLGTHHEKRARPSDLSDFVRFRFHPFFRGTPYYSLSAVQKRIHVYDMDPFLIMCRKNLVFRVYRLLLRLGVFEGMIYEIVEKISRYLLCQNEKMRRISAFFIAKI